MKNKQKIAFVTPLYLPANLSGSGMVVKDIAESLVKISMDITIVTSDALTPRYWYDPFFGKRVTKRIERINGVKVIRLRSNQLYSSSFFILLKFLKFIIPPFLLEIIMVKYNGPELINLKRLLIKESFDVIYCSPFPLNINLQVADIKKYLKKGTKLIYRPDFHAHHLLYQNKFLSKIFFEADLIQCLTRTEYEEIRALFNVPKEKIVFIPNGIDLNEYPPMDDCRVKEIKKSIISKAERLFFLQV